MRDKCALFVFLIAVFLSSTHQEPKKFRSDSSEGLK